MRAGPSALSGAGAGPGGPADDVPESGHAQIDRAAGTVFVVVELAQLVLGAGQADAQALDLAEPALTSATRLSRISSSLVRCAGSGRSIAHRTQASLNLPVGAPGSPPGLDRVGVMTGNRGRWPKINEDRGVEDVTLLILEWLGEQGVNAMIRMDAERLADDEPAWTFAASGGPLAHGMRADGRTVQQCMSVALARLRDSGLSVPF
ncbi:hypothetical protein [Streptomyces gardneri]|uniref:hypothetical protein n=1 Tax=Streptomyces gardneri TaxID=66892 RepID=UPI0036CD30C6